MREPKPITVEQKALLRMFCLALSMGKEVLVPQETMGLLDSAITNSLRRLEYLEATFKAIEAVDAEVERLKREQHQCSAFCGYCGLAALAPAPVEQCPCGMPEPHDKDD